MRNLAFIGNRQIKVIYLSKITSCPCFREHHKWFWKNARNHFKSELVLENP